MRKEKIIGKRNILKNIGTVLTIVAICITFAVVVSATPNSREDKFPDGAPFQNAIKKAIIDGNLSADNIEGTPEYITEILERNETHIKVKSITRITFKNPKGAGYENNRWPKFDVEKTEGNIKAGNYDQQIQDSILSEIQNIKDESERSEKLKEWKNYDFKSGQRKYEFSEIYEATYPKPTSFTSILPNSNYNDDILMGFTKPVHWTYSREASLYVLWWRVAWARVDAVLDAALGLRLPTTVGLNVPDTMVRGQSYTLNTNINGQDWDAAKYSAANVPPENGNEFVARGKASITVQAWARVIGNIGPYYLYNKGFDYGKSFQTPFGPYQEFPIPDLYLSPDQTGIKIYYSILWAGVGLKIDPDLGSDKITANWNTGGDAIGSGSLRYSMPNTNYYFGPVTANDYSTTTNYANIRLSDYNYYFNRCKLTLGANVQAGLTFIDLRIQSGYIDIYNYNCDGITGDLHLGTHQGTNANSVIGYSLVGPNVPINLLKNSGFETVSGTVPQYWNKSQTGTKAIFTYPEIGRGGTDKSAAIAYTTKETGKVALWRQSGIIVIPSKQYKLSGYMKLANVIGSGAIPRPGGASIRVTWYNSYGGVIKTDLINKIGTIGWVRYEGTFTSPSNAVKATVGGDLFDSSGKVWFDDLSFTKIS